MTEPANGSWLDPNVQFTFPDDPARYNPTEFESNMSPVEIRLKDMGERLEIMGKQLEWLCFHVSNILQMAQSNPMARMMMNKAMKQNG